MPGIYYQETLKLYANSRKHHYKENLIYKDSRRSRIFFAS